MQAAATTTAATTAAGAVAVAAAVVAAAATAVKLSIAILFLRMMTYNMWQEIKLKSPQDGKKERLKRNETGYK